MCTVFYVSKATHLPYDFIFQKPHNFTVVSTIYFLMHIILPQIIHMHEFWMACLINIECILLYYGFFSWYGCDGTT